MNKELFYTFIENRIFLESLSNNEIERIYKIFKQEHRAREKGAFFGTIEYLIRR